MREVFMVGAQRSPIAAVSPGKGGALNESTVSLLSPDELAIPVLRSLFETSGVSPRDLDCFVLGSAISQKVEPTLFQSPAKYIIRKACDNNPLKVVGADIEKACSTSLVAIWYAATEILLGDAEIAIAGGVDMMSRQPNEAIIRGLTDPSTGKLMAELADVKARELGFSAESHDAYAAESFARAQQHLAQPLVVPIGLPNGDMLAVDEGVSKFPPERLAKLQRRRNILLYPGCEIMTVLNSSKYGDAAAFVALASKDAIRERGLKPIARIVSFGAHGGKEPKNFVCEPLAAVQQALDRASLEPKKVGLYEINEAFPTPCLYLMREFEISRERMNPWGGAIAHGHPIGASGALLLTKAAAILAHEKGRYAVISLCNAIDEATALVIERVEEVVA